MAKFAKPPKMTTPLIHPKAPGIADSVPLPTDRLTVKQWLRDVHRQIGRTSLHFGALTALAPEWVDAAINPDHGCCPSIDTVRQVSRALRLTVPDSVQAAARRLTDAARPEPSRPVLAKQTRKAGRLGASSARKLSARSADLSPLPTRCATAADELIELIRRAGDCVWSDTPDRDYYIVRRRLGLGFDQARTLEEVGLECGLTRERVRQIEERIFNVVATKLAEIALPKVDAVITEMRMTGGLSLETFSANFQSLIGNASLPSVLTVAGGIRGIDLLSELQVTSLGRERLAAIIGTDTDAVLTNRVAILGRRQQRFAGAVSFDALRRRVELALGAPVSSAAVYAAIDLLQDISWLDEGRTWYWQSSEPPSTMLHTAAEICWLARQPISPEVLYSGLVREMRRVSPKEVAENGPTVPPLLVVLALLEKHAHFKRSYSSMVTYIGPPVQIAGKETARRSMVEYLDKQKGAATYWELCETCLADGHSMPSIKNALFLCGWFERIRSGVYVIRGRNVDFSLISDAERRVEAHLRSRSAERQNRNSRRRPPSGAPPTPPRAVTGDQWVVEHKVTSSLPSHGVLSLPSSLFPPHTSGNYVLPDGHRIGLIDTGGTVNVMNLGSALKEALRIEGASLTLSFDSRARTLSFQVEASCAGHDASSEDCAG